MVLRKAHQRTHPNCSIGARDNTIAFVRRMARAYGNYVSLVAHAQWERRGYQGKCTSHVSGPSLRWERLQFTAWLDMLGIKLDTTFLIEGFPMAFWRGYTEVGEPLACQCADDRVERSHAR